MSLLFYRGRLLFSQFCTESDDEDGGLYLPPSFSFLLPPQKVMGGESEQAEGREAEAEAGMDRGGHCNERDEKSLHEALRRPRGRGKGSLSPPFQLLLYKGEGGLLEGKNTFLLQRVDLAGYIFFLPGHLEAF